MNTATHPLLHLVSVALCSSTRAYASHRSPRVLTIGNQSQRFLGEIHSLPQPVPRFQSDWRGERWFRLIRRKPHPPTRIRGNNPKFPNILQLIRSLVRVVEHVSLRKIPGTISYQLWWRRREALCDSGFRTCSCVKFQDHIRASGGGRPVLQILKGRGNLNRSCRIEDHGQGRRD